MYYHAWNGKVDSVIDTRQHHHPLPAITVAYTVRLKPITLQAKTLNSKFSVRVSIEVQSFYLLQDRFILNCAFLIKATAASFTFPLYIKTTILCFLFTLCCKILLCFGVWRLKGEMEVTQFPEVSQH